MKKLLALVGVLAISASGVSSAILAAEANTIMQAKQTENQLSFDGQINNFKIAYDALTENQKTDVVIILAKLPNININELNTYLEHSNNNFITNNKNTIETIYGLYTSINRLSTSTFFTTQSLNFSWKEINEYLDLGFGNSNDYKPWANAYGPSSWWKIWEWGVRIDFPEGFVNVMRVVKLVTSLYNGINFTKLESLLVSGKTFFDYLINLDQHNSDKVSVLYNLVVKTRNDFKKSNVPFTQKVYNIFDQFSLGLEKYKFLNISLIKDVIKNKIEKELGLSIEELGKEYSGVLKNIVDIVSTTNSVLNGLKWLGLPIIIVDLIVGSLASIANQMINADQNHNGVYIKLQQFIVPLGFGGR